MTTFTATQKDLLAHLERIMQQYGNMLKMHYPVSFKIALAEYVEANPRGDYKFREAVYGIQPKLMQPIDPSRTTLSWAQTVQEWRNLLRAGLLTTDNAVSVSHKRKPTVATIAKTPAELLGMLNQLKIQEESLREALTTVQAQRQLLKEQLIAAI